MSHMDVEQLTLEMSVLPSTLALEASTVNFDLGKTRGAVVFENPKTERTKDGHPLVN